MTAVSVDSRAWMRDAACAGDDERAVKFREAVAVGALTDAKVLCTECPVRLDCLRWALDKQELWGVWGGLAEFELRRTLSVNASGEPIKRSRWPQCPACRARVSRLVTERDSDAVSCESCGFAWRSASTVDAVHRYFAQRSR